MTEAQFQDQKLIEDVAVIRKRLTHLTIALATLILVIFVLSLARHERPYVALVDRKTGEVMAVAGAVAGVESLTDASIEYALKDFIKNSRAVSPNDDEEKDRLRDAYALATGQASKALYDYYHDGKHYPFDVSKKGWVEVESIRVLKLPAPGNYECDWIEVAHKLNQEPVETIPCRAILKVEVKPSGDCERNPMGLYVTVFNFSADTAREKL